VQRPCFMKSALSELSKKVGTDLYILPSSVHEVIAVSTDMGTPETLSEMGKRGKWHTGFRGGTAF
jgi:hypothetical protein